MILCIKEGEENHTSSTRGSEIENSTRKTNDKTWFVCGILYKCFLPVRERIIATNDPHYGLKVTWARRICTNK